MRASIEHFINRCWYPTTDADKRISRYWSCLMTPFSWLYNHVQSNKFKQRVANSNSKPIVIVIGNISVGGTGKTPLLIALGKALQQKNISIAVISRGYGGTQKQFPYVVKTTDSASLVGDEPLLIAQSLNCPIVIGPNRIQAINYIQQQLNIDLILSDDGLQHYAMPRHFEIAVIDQQRQLGNERLLPAGPLREPITRLDKVNYIAINSTTDNTISGVRNNSLAKYQLIPFVLKPMAIRHLASNDSILLTAASTSSPLPKTHHLKQSNPYACAGIGNPKRFYTTLESLGLTITPINIGDHQPINPSLFKDDKRPIIITSKDAVKLQPLSNSHYRSDFIDRLWVLDVAIDTSNDSFQALIEQCLAFV